VTNPTRAITRRALLQSAGAAAVVLGAGRADAARPTVTVYKSPT
jgi:hypothetical protein